MMDLEGTIKDIHYGDRIFFDSVAGHGVAGTIYPVGTAGLPSNTIADVILMCAARNLKVIDVHGALTLGAAMEHYTFIGHRHEAVADTLALAGFDVDESVIIGCLVSGAQGGTGFLTLTDCILYLLTDFQGIANYCDLYGSAMSLKDGGFQDLHHCNSVHSNLIITVNAPGRASFKECSGNCKFTGQTGGDLYVRGYKGTLIIDAMTDGTCDIYANGADITINDNCSGGAINIYGDARVTVAAAATVTVNNHTLQVEGGALGLTTFDQETAVGIAAGATDVTLFDGTGITKPTKICGFKCTMTGAAWVGHPVVWIEDGAGNKIFPFQANYEEGTDFVDGEQVVFNFPVVVPVASGYNVMFRSTAAGDNAGQTLTLDNLDVIEVG